MADANYQKFRQLLNELFMLDQADLDFGIYRIMNVRRAEITRFLDQDLLPQVRETLSTLQSGDSAQVKAELEKAIEQARALGIDPDTVPRVRELREKYQAQPDLTAIENEIFSDLTSFFRRYYNEGDFLSLRRYKEGVYAIPYEGEEVKLHWANADQYYVKSSEYFRDYTFKLPDGRRVHFKLRSADTELNNNKAAAGQERRFILCDEQPLSEEDGELIIRFEYRPDPDKRKQASLNTDAAQRILSTPGFETWIAQLAVKRPSAKESNRTLLEKHLADYTARNTFDYFIHKDLGGFLRRELDFFIKNEVMHLDDIENEQVPRVEQYLAKIKAMRRIAHKIIDFLAQIENFQKKLWLKKKFVVETNYCITLDRVPEELYPEIVANDAQREEWVRLFGINEINTSLISGGNSVPLTVEFLRANPLLVLDTKFFDENFKYSLVQDIEDLDEQLDGVLIYGENFQAINLIHPRYSKQVKSIYIDPPYNTGTDEFIYKDEYRHSSWLSMMRDRFLSANRCMRNDASVLISVDDEEVSRLRVLLDHIFGSERFIANIAYERSGSAGIGQGGILVNTKEYILFYSMDRSSLNSIGYERPVEFETMKRYNKVLLDEGDKRLIHEFRSKVDGSPVQMFEHSDFKITSISLKNYDNRNHEIIGEYIGNFDRIFRTNNVQKENTFQNDMIALMSKDRLYTVIYTPTRGKNKGVETTLYYYNKELFAWLKDTARVSNGTILKWNKLTDMWSHSEIPKADLANEGGVYFPRGKKPEQLLQRLINITSNPGDVILDFFLGSGTTSAVAHKMRRKWIGVESSDYFDPLPVTRLKRVLYGEPSGISKQVSWQGGGFFKYIRLESYEDTLNNLELRRTEVQARLLEDQPALREDYMLRYMLDVESRGSPSLLNIERFDDPFNYQLSIATGSAGETRPVTVDLVETFNYLIGLRVKHIDTIRGVKVVQGTSPEGEKVLVIWRNVKELDNDALDSFFQRQGYNTRDREFDVIYVNGDNNLENLRRPDETWKVRLIEEEFHRLMFDVRDV